jgi:hypothetical protein
VSHRCPAIGCSEQLEEDWKVMCGSHWHLVPAEIQRVINRPNVSQLVRGRLVDEAIKAVERAEFGGRLL